MPLWLHPVHVQADGHCSPLKLSGDERSRGDKINSTLLQVAQAQDGLKEKPAVTPTLSTLTLNDGHLVANEDISIPLLCADIAWIGTEALSSFAGSPFDRLETEELTHFRSLLAIAPRWKNMQMALLEAFDPRGDELWIIGASFQPGTPEMAACLQMLSKHGTIRWDIEREFLFHKHVIGHGISSTTRLGMPKKMFSSISEMADSETCSEDECVSSYQPVAIKILKNPVNEVQATSIVTEIRHLAACEHPNILCLLGTFSATIRPRNYLVLALEYCNTGPLSEYVSTSGHLDLITGQVASVSLLSGIAYLHSKQIYHRDLRPQNILLDLKGKEIRPVVANFGRATSTEIESSQSNGYCAPEVLDSRLGAQGFASDVFSIGAVMLFLLTGLERGSELTSVTWQPSLTGASRLDEIAASKLPEFLVDFLLRLLVLNVRKRPMALEACRLLYEESPEEVQESSVASKAMSALPVSGASKHLMPIISENRLEETEEGRLEGAKSLPRGGSFGYAPISGPDHGYVKDRPPGAAPMLKIMPPSSPATASPRRGRSCLSLRRTTATAPSVVESKE